MWNIYHFLHWQKFGFFHSDFHYFKLHFNASYAYLKYSTIQIPEQRPYLLQNHRKVYEMSSWSIFVFRRTFKRSYLKLPGEEKNVWHFIAWIITNEKCHFDSTYSIGHTLFTELLKKKNSIWKTEQGNLGFFIFKIGKMGLLMWTTWPFINEKKTMI